MDFQRLRQAHRQRGLAMVEFAIVLPVLLLLLLAVAEMGRMLYHYNSLLQSSRDAVRYVAAEAWDVSLGKIVLTDGIKHKARNIAVYGLPLTTGIPIVPQLTTADVSVAQNGNNHVSVSIAYVFRPIFGNGIPAIVGDAIRLDIPLVASTVMRAL